MRANVSLTPETAENAKCPVAIGFYNSIREDVRESFRLQRKLEKLVLRELHQELSLAADQIDNKQTELHDMESIIDRSDVKLARRNQL